MNLKGTRDMTPQRAARKRAYELRKWAEGIRDFVEKGKVEIYQEERRSGSGKVLRKEALKTRGMDEHEGRKLIQEAERLELLAAVTLEYLGINDEPNGTPKSRPVKT